MNENREEVAIQFARNYGFDGVIPTGWGCVPVGGRPPDVPDDCDWYEAGVYCHPGDPKPMHPFFDSALHIIVVDNNGARWRTEKDAIKLNRELITV